MEQLLVVALIAALPLSIFMMIAKMTGNKIITFIFLKLPSLIILIVAIQYFLKLYKII